MIVNSKDWQIVNQEARRKKGPLVTIDLGRGRSVKMYEADAIAQGFLKGKPQAENKMLTPPANKAAAPEEKPDAPDKPADDFTTIPGVGPATARALAAHGIATFDQLEAAGELAFLSGKAREAIEKWRAHG